MARYKYTFCYFILIILVNSLFVYIPVFEFANTSFSPADMAVGSVYVLRDLSQREIRHWIILVMLLGCGISYLLPEKSVALASLAAFTVGETIDWLIFTISKKPLSQRLLISSVISVPADSFIFLYLVNMLNWLNCVMLVLSKCIGIMIIWSMWRNKNNSPILVNQATKSNQSHA